MKKIVISIIFILLFVGSAHSETAQELGKSLGTCLYGSLQQRLAYYPSTILEDSFRIAMDKCNSQYNRCIDAGRRGGDSEREMKAFDREIVMQFTQWYSELKR